MVGRLYKVRCRECRRRKIKCPAEQPGCSRCLKNGFVCPGYEEKELEFVNTTGKDLVSRQGGSRKLQTSKTTTHRLLPKATSPHTPGIEAQGLSPWYKGNASFTKALAELPPNNHQRSYRHRLYIDTKSILNSPSTAAANLLQLFATCTSLDFKFFVVIPSKTEILGNWFADLPSYAFDDPLLEHALQAVTLIHLGKASNDQNILRNGRLCYGNALNELQVAARRQRTDARMLAVCNIMCLYELYDSVIAQAGGFMEHIKGAQILGMAINASNLTRPEEIKCYYVFRTLAIYNSCGARKSCPLAYAKRPPLPADIDGKGSSDFYENLEDITIFIPKLVERSDDLLHLPWNEENDRQFEHICSQFKHFTTELSAWYAHVHDLYPSPFWGEPENTSHHPDFDFGPSYQFSFFWIAQALMHYWGARILLYDAYAQALQWKHNLPFHTPSTPSAYHQQLLSNPTTFSQHTLDHHILTSTSQSPPSQTYTLIRHAQVDLAISIRKSLHYIWSSDFGTCSIFRTANATVLASRVFESLATVEGEEGVNARRQLGWMEGVKRHYEKMKLAIRELSDIGPRDWRRMLESGADGR